MQKNDFSMKLGRNLKNFRLLRGLSVDKLAEIIGITADSVRKYERGERKMSVEDMIGFSIALDCDEQNILQGLNPSKDSIPSPFEIKKISNDERKILRTMSTTWKGDRKSLIILDGEYMVLPESRRLDIAMYIQLQIDEAIKAGEISISDLPENIDYLQRIIGKKSEKEGG